MARTTGFPCALAARLLARGELRLPGVLPPERFGCDAKIFEFFRAGLDARGVKLQQTIG
jgi:saccharopine dehydrogenase-like NADP-dependent oxidoreductase